MPTSIDPRRRSSPPPLPSIPTRLPGRVASFLRQRGIDPAPLVERFGLPRTLERDPFVFFGAGQIAPLLAAAEALSGDPFLAVHVAESAGHDSFGTLLFACSGGDGRTALDRYVRYFGSFHAELLATVEHREAGSLVKIAMPGRAECLGRAFNEHWAVSLTIAARHLTEARVAPESVHLAHADSRSRGELIRLLGTSSILFDQGYNGLMFGRGDLSRRTRDKEAPVDALLHRYSLAVPLAPAGVGGLRGRVREAIASTLSEGEPGIQPIARSLGMSARTLQRRLSESALTFQQVLDELRRDIAVPHVRRGELSLDAIALQLGYSQLSAFLRAFRRWTGATPRELRSAPPES